MAEEKLIDIILGPLDDLTPAELEACHERLLAEADASSANLKKRIEEMRASLTDREREVLDMRRDISKNADPVTQERIREIEEKALRKLRAHLKAASPDHG